MQKGMFYVTEELGPKRSLTPEGFLLCEEVPIARAGMMIYGPEETPIKPALDGDVVKIFRNEEDIHHPDAIASAVGKPVTWDHPEEDVTPENWKELVIGVMLNVRPGTDAQSDLLFADLLITIPEAIEAILNNVRKEVSLGYEVNYEELGPGMGKQTGILVNHVAVVQNGRCGPRCAIRDSNQEVKKMTVKKDSFLDILMRAFKAKDASEVEKIATELDERPEAAEAAGAQGEAKDDKDDDAERWKKNDEEHAELRSRIEALEKTVLKQKDTVKPEEDAAVDPNEVVEDAILDEIPEQLKKGAKEAKDSAYLLEPFKEAIADAEILVPGIKIPVVDSTKPAAHTFKKLCKFRRSALDKAYKNADTQEIIDSILGGRTLDTKAMTCDAVRTMFRSAVAMKKAANVNKLRVQDRAPVANSSKKPQTLADLNRRNAEIYKED